MDSRTKALLEETESEMQELVEGRRSNRWSGSDMRRMSALVEGVRELDKLARHATEQRDAFAKRIDELEAELEIRRGESRNLREELRTVRHGHRLPVAKIPGT